MQVLLLAARRRPGGHIQPTEPPLSIRQPNWHLMVKQTASPGRSKKPTTFYCRASILLTKTVCKPRNPLRWWKHHSADSLHRTFKHHNSVSIFNDRKLLTAAGGSICTERVPSLAVTAIATVCIHAALGARSPRETALVHIWSQYEALFERPTDNSHAKRCRPAHAMGKKLVT